MKYIVDAIIEIPMGTKNKFEVNKETGKITLDRVLYLLQICFFFFF